MSEAAKILVIDDSEDDRMLYRRSLHKREGRSYRMIEAGDGEAGMRLAKEENPSCVLLDYSLPGRDGIEVLKRIHAAHPFLPVVMLTGQGNENVAVTAMKEGAQNYINKATITPEVLDHVIRMAQEHCQMQKRIHEQRMSLETFTHALAHDLREPMRTIRSYVELIGRGAELPVKIQGYLKYVQNASERMHMLISTVFHYTRLGEPGEIEREECDMEAVLQGVTDNLEQLIREKAAVVTHDAPLPKVQANSANLMQVLQNLISNAIHHCTQTPRIHVSAESLPEAWRFCVKDNGPGVEADYIETIFEPFKRLSHADAQRAGLGLATCRKIVELHGGKIWCESTPGRGAAFFFTLPKSGKAGQ